MLRLVLVLVLFCDIKDDEKERARAELLGYKDPINADYPATSAMYHKVIFKPAIIIRNSKMHDNRCFIFLGPGRMSHKDPWAQSKEFYLSS